MRRTLIAAFIVTAGILTINQEASAFFGFGKKNKAEIVQVVGSDTCLNVTQHITESYMKGHKDARIAVTGGGSGVGIAAAINGTTDIAMASRSAKSSEMEKAEANGKKLEEVVFGWDGIGVIVNKNNPINVLSKEVIGKIFEGKITNWKEVGGKDAPIVILSRDSSSGTHSYFKKDVVRGGDKKSKKEYSDTSLFLPSNSAIVQETASNENAIGYVGMGYLDDTTKALGVNGIEPTVANVSSKAYPIARELFWYVPAERSQVITNIVKFALSSEGQSIVAKEGFVPAK
ncbi:PstS family phosphate ABC transporter substrate-binding protein [uncultured Ilyobacter sp.]|uniref:PstS family phosphate ABC transporter substrate-binding protein n=1 Tax=uncultured Ilyobacter sp. TaxID=544433 RepID=UPI0029C0512B|nr:PstS family phosphate ABC transporter substrate-binding protein [uncultured Ilyobacter sp.]